MGCESTLLGNRHAKFTLLEVWLCMEKMTVVYIINFMDFKNVHVNVLAQANDQFFNVCYVLKYVVATGAHRCKGLLWVLLKRRRIFLVIFGDIENFYIILFIDQCNMC